MAIVFISELSLIVCGCSLKTVYLANKVVVVKLALKVVIIHLSHALTDVL